MKLFLIYIFFPNLLRSFVEAHSHFHLSFSLTSPSSPSTPHILSLDLPFYLSKTNLPYPDSMKLIRFADLFSKKSRSKLKKKIRSESPSFRSSATNSSSDDLTPKSVLPRRESFSVAFSFSDFFGVFDRDGDGKITKRELEIVLRRLSSDPPTDDELTAMVAEIDRDGDGCISLEELGAIGAETLGTPAAGGELRDAFAVFDADGDGKISAEELLGVFLAIGDGGCTIDDCRRMIGVVDSDGDGYVCFEDFVRMMDGQR